MYILINLDLYGSGVHYQTTPFNGWYQITEIARDLLDRQRYDLAEVVAAACDISKTTLSLWRDDVQLQVHKAILHSFAEKSISCADHHAAGEAFMDFYSTEVEKQGECPGKIDVEFKNQRLFKFVAVLSELNSMNFDYLFYS
jgi:nitric-oxide synthase